MIFSRDGGRRQQHRLVALHLAAHPRAVGRHVGLNYDPSHLVWLIDQGRFIREFGPHPPFPGEGRADRPRRLYERGSMSSGIGWQIRACPAWATPTGARSATCTASATTATASSSTRTAASRAPTSWSARLLLARNILRPYIPIGGYPMTTAWMTDDPALLDRADLPRRRQDDRPLAAAARAGRPVHRRQLPAGGRVRRRVGHRPTGRCRARREAGRGSDVKVGIVGPRTATC